MPELNFFQKLSKEALSELLDVSLKSLTQKLQPSEAFSRFKIICKNSNVEFSDCEPLIQSLLQLCKDAVKKSKPAVQLNDELFNLGMNDEQIEIFKQQWENIQASLMNTSSVDPIPINPLVDMEWKFGVTSASSQVNSIGNVFLQIKLEIDQGNERNKTVCFELGLTEFYAFLHEMERARASLDYLS